MVYKWKQHQHKVKAEEVGAILEALPEITAEAVVNAARPETSPLHSLFNWDDTAAAEEWRRQQARVLIANIQIVEAEQPTTRAFLNIKTVNGDSAYVSTPTVMADDEMREHALQTALKELQSFRRKYSRLSQLATIFEAIDEQLAKPRQVTPIVLQAQDELRA